MATIHGDIRVDRSRVEIIHRTIDTVITCIQPSIELIVLSVEDIIAWWVIDLRTTLNTIGTDRFLNSVSGQQSQILIRAIVNPFGVDLPPPPPTVSTNMGSSRTAPGGANRRTRCIHHRMAP